MRLLSSRTESLARHGEVEMIRDVKPGVRDQDTTHLQLEQLGAPPTLPQVKLHDCLVAEKGQPESQQQSSSSAAAFQRQPFEAKLVVGVSSEDEMEGPLPGSTQGLVACKAQWQFCFALLW